ncbi:MAG TPA: DUF4203 domain-containing protein, partial [Acidobacteriota bacterium]|nr:DUF4203 domain-containing protein [Acidobacteriota bacterium]
QLTSERIRCKMPIVQGYSFQFAAADTWAAGLAIVLGLLACFAGYRIFRVLLGILGFLGGALLAGGLTWTFLTQSQTVTIVVGILGGLLGAALLSIFYFLGIFALGAAFGGLLGYLLAPVVSLEPIVGALLLGIICGILTLAAQRLLITVSTAFGGAWAVLSGISFFLGVPPLQELLHRPPVEWSSPRQLLVFAAWLVLGAAGIAAQYSRGNSTNSRKKD